MVIGEGVVIGLFFKECAGIDKLGFVVAFVFGEHEDIDGNGGSKKEVGSQWDNGFNEVVFDQVFTNFLFRTASVKDTREADNGGTPFTGEVAECMEHKSKVGFGFGSQYTGRSKAFIVDESWVIASNPVHRIRGIWNNGIKGFIIAKMRI